MKLWYLTLDRLPTRRPAANHLRLERFVRGLGPGELFSVGSNPQVQREPPLWGSSHSRLPGLSDQRPPLVLLGTMLMALPYLRRLVRRRPPELLFVNSVIYGPLLKVLRLGPNPPRVWLDVMGLASLEVDQAPLSSLERRLRRAVWQRLERQAFAAADVITTVNEAHRERIRLLYGRDAQVLRDVAPERVPPGPPELLETLDIRTNDVVVLFVGAFIQERLLPLLEAFPAALAAAPRLRLLLVGEGPDLPRYRELAASLGDRVVFAGYRGDGELARLLERADVCYSDCWSELGFPAKAFDYMAYGKAILIEGKPQMREVLDEDSCRFYSDSAELSARLLELVDDEELRRRMGEEASHRAGAYSEETFQSRLREIADPPRPRRRDEPRVAVIIPCYNDGATLDEAVDSALTQGESVELVVVDDGSTDTSTVAVLDRLKSQGIQVVHQANAGPSAARNRGLSETTAPYVFPLDADDVLPAGALAVMANALDRNAALSLVWGDIETFGDERNRMPAAFWLDPWEITYYSEIPGTTLMRREAITSAGGWRAGGYEDWSLFMTLAERGLQGQHVGRTTLLYRIHGQRGWQNDVLRHAELMESLKARHSALFATRSRNRRRSKAPGLLKLLLPLVDALPLPERRRFTLHQALAHIAYRRDWRPPLARRLKALTRA